MTELQIPATAGGYCAERHSARATAFRIQKPNSFSRSFAFVVHSKVANLFSDIVGAQHLAVDGQTYFYTPELGFADVEQLFTMACPPDFLTILCPEIGWDEKQFCSVISRVDRWMHHRFITTIMISPAVREAPQKVRNELMGELRHISSQLVWANDGQDLEEVLTALRFFPENYLVRKSSAR